MYGAWLVGAHKRKERSTVFEIPVLCAVRGFSISKFSLGETFKYGTNTAKLLRNFRCVIVMSHNMHIHYYTDCVHIIM